MFHLLQLLLDLTADADADSITAWWLYARAWFRTRR